MGEAERIAMQEQQAKFQEKMNREHAYAPASTEHGWNAHGEGLMDHLQRHPRPYSPAQRQGE